MNANTVLGLFLKKAPIYSPALKIKWGLIKEQKATKKKKTKPGKSSPNDTI